MLRHKWLKLPIVLRVPLAAVIVDDVEQLSGVGGDSILPSLLGAEDFNMIGSLKMWIKMDHTLW